MSTPSRRSGAALGSVRISFDLFASRDGRRRGIVCGGDTRDLQRLRDFARMGVSEACGSGTSQLARAVFAARAVLDLFGQCSVEDALCLVYSFGRSSRDPDLALASWLNRKSITGVMCFAS